MENIVKISDFIMAHGGSDGKKDDGIAIQEAIQHCFDTGARVLEFDEIENGEPKTYIVNSELCVYGKNLTINGNGCKLRKTKAFTSKSQSQFGALFSIYGLIPNMIYNGKQYTETQRPAKNIVVIDLHVVFVPDVTKTTNGIEELINGFAISEAEDVQLISCTAYGAPQTDFAVVSGVNSIGAHVNVKNAILNACTGINSRQHTFRLNAMDQSKYLTATMYNCIARNTLGINSPGYGIGKNKAHLLCNATPSAAGEDGNEKIFYQIVDGCVFDETGAVYVNNYCRVAFRGCMFYHKDKVQKLSEHATISIGK